MLGMIKIFDNLPFADALPLPELNLANKVKVTSGIIPHPIACTNLDIANKMKLFVIAQTKLDKITIPNPAKSTFSNL